MPATKLDRAGALDIASLVVNGIRKPWECAGHHFRNLDADRHQITIRLLVPSDSARDNGASVTSGAEARIPAQDEHSRVQEQKSLVRQGLSTWLWC